MPRYRAPSSFHFLDHASFCLTRYGDTEFEKSNLKEGISLHWRVSADKLSMTSRDVPLDRLIRVKTEVNSKTTAKIETIQPKEFDISLPFPNPNNHGLR